MVARMPAAPRDAAAAASREVVRALVAPLDPLDERERCDRAEVPGRGRSVDAERSVRGRAVTGSGGARGAVSAAAVDRPAPVNESA